MALGKSATHIEEHGGDTVPAIYNKTITQEAEERNAFEHSLTVRQAIKYYKWAIFWCLAVRYEINGMRMRNRS